MIHIEVYEDKLGGSTPNFKIRLPAMPLRGDTLTLPGNHYIVEEIYYQAKIPDDPGKGYIWPDTHYYTIRMVVRQKQLGD